MNILLLGATGFVGQQVAQLLMDRDFKLICAGRDLTALRQQFPQAQSLYCDFLTDTSLNDWLPRLAGIDILINCVGIFYYRDRERIWRIHFDTPKLIYAAAQQTNIRQIIHLSALGIENYENDYAKSKRAIENFLNTLAIPHVVLRPSLIYGPHSKGGMDILKKLAACPGIIPLPSPGTQLFQPIHVSDLAKAISNLILHPPLNPSITLAAVPSQKLSLKELLGCLRQWLGFNTKIFIKIPFFIIKLIGRIGDLGRFALVNTVAINMIKQGNYTTLQEAAKFKKITHVEPLHFKQGLARYPSFNESKALRLFLIRPLLRISLAIMWLMSALTSILAYSKTTSYLLLSNMGISTNFQPFILYGASILNALIGFSLLLNYKTKINCLGQLLVITLYSLIITLKLPYLWLEPFGPVVKNLPIFLSIYILYILES